MCIAVHQRIESNDTVPKNFQESQNSDRPDKTVDSDPRRSVKGTASGKILIEAPPQAVSKSKLSQMIKSVLNIILLLTSILTKCQ